MPECDILGWHALNPFRPWGKSHLGPPLASLLQSKVPKEPGTYIPLLTVLLYQCITSAVLPIEAGKTQKQVPGLTTLILHVRVTSINATAQSCASSSFSRIGNPVFWRLTTNTGLAFPKVGGSKTFQDMSLLLWFLWWLIRKVSLMSSLHNNNNL